MAQHAQSPHNHSAHEEAHEHHVVSLATYYKVFAALMVGLVLTVAVALVDFAHLMGPQWAWLNITIAMIIAVAKAIIVVLFFMHVKYSSRLTQIFAGAGLLWLSILFIFTLADYFTRDWQQVPNAWRVPGQSVVIDNPAVSHGEQEPLPEVQQGLVPAPSESASETAPSVAH